MQKIQKKKTLYFVVAIAVIVITLVIPANSLLSSIQCRALGILLAALILWLTESIPMSIATLLLIVLMQPLGLMTFDDIIANFGVNTSLFIMASSGMTIAIATSNIPNYITAKIFNKANGHPKSLLFVLGIVITLFSGFVSSLATCTLFYALVSSALKQADLRPNNSKLAKALMLMIPACSGIGGFISPAGTPANLLVLEILEKQGIIISFAKWCSIGLPISIITSVVFLCFLVLVIKPERESEINILNTSKFTFRDWIIIAVTLLVIIGWFLSGYINFFNTTTIALLGLSLLFIPQFEILDINKFSKGVNWDLVLSMGTVSVLMTGISETGLISKFVGAVFSNITELNSIIVLIIISLVICITRAFVPTTTAVVALLTPVLLEMAQITSLNITALMLITAFWAASALLLVFTEPIYLITYKEGYYKEKDLLKVGIPTSITVTIVCSILILYFSLNL